MNVVPSPTTTRVAVIGYGSQGRAHALNLRESGFDVVVGVRPGGASWKAAEEDAWIPKGPTEAVKQAKIIAMLVPDMAQPDLYAALEPHIAPHTTLLFAHGFNVHYDTLSVRADVDVTLVAPKGPGALVRRQYQQGFGVPSLMAVHHDASGQAQARTEAYAAGIGSTRAALLTTTFAEETETDLFGEQAVLCGGATELVLAGFETLTEAGYSPEVAYFECMHELKLIVDLLYEGGLERMHEFISDTAQFGDLTRGSRVIDASTRQRMRKILEEIQDKTFAREWIDENENGCTHFDKLKANDLAHPIEVVGRKLRSQMAWLSPHSHEPAESTP